MTCSKKCGLSSITLPFHYAFVPALKCIAFATKAVAGIRGWGLALCCLGFAVALNAQTPIPTNQLAAIYLFEEGTGTTTADASWNNNTGTISNAVWTTAGRYGGCLSFDGTGWVTVNDSPSLDLSNGMTLEAWVYPAGAISGWRTFIMKEIADSGTGDNYGYLLAADPEGRPTINISTTSANYQQAVGQLVLPSNTWTHLAGTYDGTTLRLYVNGIKVAETPVTGSILTSSDALRIGGNSIWPEYFSGRIDDVRIYNQALSQGQIQMNMNGLDFLTVPLDTTNQVNVQAPIPTSQWAAIYRFNEGTGTITADASWNENTGMVGNATWNSAGHYGSCLSFDGTAWVTVNDSPSLELTNGMTLEAWVYPTNAPLFWTTFVLKEATDDLEYMLAMDPAGYPNVGVSTTTLNDQGVTGPSPLPLNAWTHLAGTYDGATIKLYVNGIKVAEKSATGNILTSPQPLRLGGNAIWGEYLSGSLDEVRIYNQALSQNQIRMNMNGLDVLTVTVNSTNRVYGSANPAFTGTVAGLLAGDNITVTYTTGATPASPAGDYDVVPSFSNPDGSLTNYLVVTNVGTLTIGQATLMFTLSTCAGTNHISGTAEANVTYTVQASPDLVHWQDIGTATAGTNGAFEFEEVGVSSVGTRFYRISKP